MIARLTQRRVKTDGQTHPVEPSVSAPLQRENEAAYVNGRCIHWASTWKVLLAMLVFLAYMLFQLSGTRPTTMSEYVTTASATAASGLASVRSAVSSSTADRFQFNNGLAIVTVASHQKVSVSAGVEYGELKSAFVYPVSIDNKARYCALHGCTLVVGGPLPEALGRSARWLKVAWLRRSLSTYKWLVWMDLDALFARPDESLEKLLDPCFDLHVTHDFGRDDKYNTGFFALRASAWSFMFLEQVWAHNDFGVGQSDQASINHCIGLLSSWERAAHVKVYSRELLNAFPQVSHFIPVQNYELPKRRGDEIDGKSLVVHFAGQFGGACSFDGSTPPLMLLQFMDLLLAKHQTFLQRLQTLHRSASTGPANDVAASDDQTLRFSAPDGLPPPINSASFRGSNHDRLTNFTANTTHYRSMASAAMAAWVTSPADVTAGLLTARAALAPCLELLRSYQTSYNYHLGITVMVPPESATINSFSDSSGSGDGSSSIKIGSTNNGECNPSEPLTKLRHTLSTLLPATPVDTLNRPATTARERTSRTAPAFPSEAAAPAAPWPRFLLCVEPSLPSLASAPSTATVESSEPPSSLLAAHLATLPHVPPPPGPDGAVFNDFATVYAETHSSPITGPSTEVSSSGPLQHGSKHNFQVFKVDDLWPGDMETAVLKRLNAAAAAASATAAPGPGIPKQDDQRTRSSSDATSHASATSPLRLTVAVTGCALFAPPTAQASIENTLDGIRGSGSYKDEFGSLPGGKVFDGASVIQALPPLPPLTPPSTNTTATTRANVAKSSSRNKNHSPPLVIERYASLAVLPLPPIRAMLFDGRRSRSSGSVDSFTAEDFFWLLTAPLLLSYVSHLPKQTRLVFSGTTTSSNGHGSSGRNGRIVRPSSQELVVLSDLGLDPSQWVDDLSSSTTWDIGGSGSDRGESSSGGTLFYGEEVFTFFLSGALPKKQSVPSPSATAARTRGREPAAAATNDDDDLVVARQVELGLHQAWRVCKALREHHERVATAADATTFAHLGTSRTTRPLAVVACSVQKEGKGQTIEGHGTRLPLSFDCDAQARALREAFRTPLSSGSSDRSSSSRRHDGSTRSNEKRGEGIEVDVVTWRGGAALRDQAAYDLLQRAAVLVSENSEEMLLALLGHSNHPLVLNDAFQELPPALAVAYWHNDSPSEGEADYASTIAPSRMSTSRSLPYRARALAAAGIDVWPMFASKENRSSRLDLRNSKTSSDTAARDLEHMLTRTVAAALAQWKSSSHRSSSSSGSSSSGSSSSSSSSSDRRRHGGRKKGDKGARQSGEREGKEWFEWRQASLAAHGGPSFLNLEAHVPNLSPATVRLGPVADRDLFGAFLEATFGGGSSATKSASSNGGSSSSSTTGTSATASHIKSNLGEVGRAKDGKDIATEAAATQIGIEVGPEIGDFAAQVLQKWPSCRGYFLVDDDISEKSKSNTEVRTKAFAPWSETRPGSGEGGPLRIVPTSQKTIKASASFTERLLHSPHHEERAIPQLPSKVAFVYLDLADRSEAATAAALNAFWPKVISGGVLGGHDYAASRPGVVRAVHAFAHHHRLAVELTDVQRPRNDVLGRPIPPCCPTWYFIKP